MRTTLTLDDDVAARLEQLSRENDVSWKALVNDALRAGLDALALPRRATRYATPPVTLRPRIHDLDDVQRVLDEVDGPWRR